MSPSVVNHLTLHLLVAILPVFTFYHQSLGNEVKSQFLKTIEPVLIISLNLDYK